MQLPPRSSSSYTVIPEKSFHLCQTCTLSSSCARTHKRGPCTLPLARVNTHSHLTELTHRRLFLSFFLPHPRSPDFQRHPCQHSTETQPHLAASKSALQFSLQCKASLFPYKSPLHRRALSPKLPPTAIPHIYSR